jgi:ABC-type transport system involved in multi-copper enzyme maturation permease subunit
VLLAGLTGLVLFVLPAMAEAMDSPEAAAAGGPIPFAMMLGRSVFFEMGTMVIAMGVIVLTQESIISELQNGVAEWLLSKPVQRRAYLLSKVLSNSLGFVFMLIVPAALAYGLFSLRISEWYPLQPFLAAVGLMAAHAFFYLALTVLLSVSVSSRTVGLGLAFGSLFGGSLILMIFQPLMYVTPWMIAKTASAVFQGASLPAGLAWGSAVGTFCLSVALIAITQFVFERREF